MKGYTLLWKDRKRRDASPCFFCKYRNKDTVCSPCYNCIDLQDIARHAPNAETEFVNYEPISEMHLKVLEWEQKHGKEIIKNENIRD